MTDKIQVGDAQYTIFPFDGLDEARVKRLPFALKILLENLLRHRGQLHVQESDIDALVNWDSKAEPDTEIAFVPSRVLLQDFTGVPAIVDLAAMRADQTDAIFRM